MSCGVSHRHGLDLALLWLWHRPAATTQIGPLAWKPPYVAGMALKRQEKKPKNPILLFPLEWGKNVLEFPLWLPRLRTQHSIRENMRSIPGLAQWVKYPACCKLRCRSKMWLRSDFAVSVVQAGSCSSDSIPVLGTSICCKCGHKDKKKKNVSLFVSHSLPNQNWTERERKGILEQLLEWCFHSVEE